MIYTVTLNPAVDRELTVGEIAFDTVLRASQWQVDCGGKGFNVARMLNSLGVPSVAMGFAAGKTGELLEEKLVALGIETDFVWVEGETRTNVSIVSSESSHYVKVNEPGPTIKESDLALLKEKIVTNVKPGDWWVLAGSLPPGVAADFYGELIELIHSAGAKVFLDTSGEPLKQSCAAGPLLVKPNDEEAHELTGLPVSTTEEIAVAAEALKKLGPANVIVSLGKEGALLVNGQDTWKAASPAIVEKNPIGAGDSMVAGVVWGLSEGVELSEALRWGIACGAATAGQNGTTVGTLAQVRDLLPKVKLIQL
ncbi:1-phosphofructokinase [Desulfogranum marinum]|uniref:1-phosphofructokinase n=1 Tax=Desulfogranum marinum TaxID=453220 RepID=UPI0019622D29|nr:1-phosphofructokinase [Desulfogranum marinum]MBM9514657.1 1-phosphofructokinase [Desulfogranum marinum]